MSSDRFPDRLRGGDAAALLELAHATYGRALAVVRAADWSTDPETMLLDAYVALYLRRAHAPDALVERWALAEVLTYCEERAALARRPAPNRPHVLRVLPALFAIARSAARAAWAGLRHSLGTVSAPAVRGSAG